jgi:hypothetical protein
VEEVRFRFVDFDSRVEALADRAPEFVDACLDGVDRDHVNSKRWARVVPSFVRGAVEALRFQPSYQAVAGEVEVTLYRGFGLYEVPQHSLDHGAEQDGFNSFMDWLAKADGFCCDRLRVRLERPD